LEPAPNPDDRDQSLREELVWSVALIGGVVAYLVLGSLFAHRAAPNPGVGLAADRCTFLDSPSIAADGTGPDLANRLGGWWLAIMSLGIEH
jgi:hypothetical protein